MADHTLATSEDLRRAAESHCRAFENCFWEAGCSPSVLSCADRLHHMADALDALHALPGLREAMERLEPFIKFASRPGGEDFQATADGMRRLSSDVNTVLDRLHLLLPPGEPQEER